MIRRFPHLLALCLATGALLATPASAPAAGCPDAYTQPLYTVINLARFEASVFCLVNEERTDRGLAPLNANGALAGTAAGHSSSMRWNGYFSHDSIDGSPFEDRIETSGYLIGADEWFVGENIAWGSMALGTPNALVTAWMNSAGHRRNILDPSFQDLGVGADWGSPRNPFELLAIIVTTDFGYRSAEVQAKPKRKSKKRKKKRRHRRKRQRA